MSNDKVCGGHGIINCRWCNEKDIPEFIASKGFFPLLVFARGEYWVIETPAALPVGITFTVVTTNFVYKERICLAAQPVIDLSGHPPKVLCDEDRQKVRHDFTNGS